MVIHPKSFSSSCSLVVLSRFRSSIFNDRHGIDQTNLVSTHMA